MQVCKYGHEHAACQKCQVVPEIIRERRGHLDSAASTGSLRSDLNILDPTGGWRKRLAVLAHSLKVKFNRVPNRGFRLG